MSTGLIVTETTLDMDNPLLWSKVTPQSVLTCTRAMVANRLGTTAKKWILTNLQQPIIIIIIII